MSINFHIFGEREILIKNTGKSTTQTCDFDCWQTPTSITHKILKSPDIVAAYKEWVLSITQDEVEEVYADDDIFCEKLPIGTLIYNAGKEHVTELDVWLIECTNDGYEITFEGW